MNADIKITPEFIRITIPMQPIDVWIVAGDNAEHKIRDGIQSAHNQAHAVQEALFGTQDTVVALAQRLKASGDLK